MFFYSYVNVYQRVYGLWMFMVYIWVCLKIGYTPNEIAIFHRDNDQQNHWVKRGTQHFQTHPYIQLVNGSYAHFPLLEWLSGTVPYLNTKFFTSMPLFHPKKLEDNGEALQGRLTRPFPGLFSLKGRRKRIITYYNIC